MPSGEDAGAGESADAAVSAFIAANEAKSLLRFITCGSVDDGKSTLIGRLLYDAHVLLADQLATLESDSRRPGRARQSLDFASLVDGLAAEREQGITIDVAYRYFATATRKFIVADTPGHEHYTRNMVTGASTAQAAVILVDARKGLLPQTRRHSLIVDLLRIPNIVLAVNKMDLVGHRQDVFDGIAADYRAFADTAGIAAFTPIPVAALTGQNVAGRSDAMPWYQGPTLLEHLEQVPVAGAASAQSPFRMPVQLVSRSDGATLCAGTVAGGAVRPGETVTLLPSNVEATVQRIVAIGGDLAHAEAGQAVMVGLAGDVPVERGVLLAAIAAPPPVTDRFEAMLVWLAGEGMVPDRKYGLKIGTRTVAARVEQVVGLVDVRDGVEVAGRALCTNDIGRCRLHLDDDVVAPPYAESRALGGFILIDPVSNATVAAGMIRI